eukprot:gb/GECG01016761.1/.p1 GENE.gb/GECG01016761.1/~~gb/GECG01016761.1/.p1  ORF type:complete len:519 (+),score=91.61 gb/GECG01016761.1/:1-1557(+)
MSTTTKTGSSTTSFKAGGGTRGKGSTKRAGSSKTMTTTSPKGRKVLPQDDDPSCVHKGPPAGGNESSYKPGTQGQTSESPSRVQAHPQQQQSRPGKTTSPGRGKLKTKQPSLPKLHRKHPSGTKNVAGIFNHFPPKQKSNSQMQQQQQNAACSYATSMALASASAANAALNTDLPGDTSQGQPQQEGFSSYFEALNECYANCHQKPVHPGINATPEQKEQYERELKIYEDTQLRLQTNQAIVLSQQEQERKRKRDREYEEGLKLAGKIKPYFEEKDSVLLSECETMTSFVSFLDSSTEALELFQQFPSYRPTVGTATDHSDCSNSANNNFHEQPSDEDMRTRVESVKKSCTEAFQTSGAAQQCLPRAGASAEKSGDATDTIHDPGAWSNDFAEQVAQLRRVMVDLLLMGQRVIHWYPHWGTAFVTYLSKQIDDQMSSIIKQNEAIGAFIDFLQERNDQVIHEVFIQPPRKPGEIPNVLMKIPEEYKPKFESDDSDILEIFDETKTGNHEKDAPVEVDE